MSTREEPASTATHDAARIARSAAPAGRDADLPASFGRISASRAVQPPRRTARLALVLGSGGVRGAAAIGVAEVLAREKPAPDLIVGCSSGALFGAALALGLPFDQTLAMARDLWSADLTEQRRWLAYPQLLMPRLARFDAATFAMRDDRRIRRALERAFGDRRIESLSLPLRIVATDAARGTPVVIDHGPLVPALRASMAVPLLFPGVTLDGRRLVDGVISDPLPVAAAADAAAVIALGFEGAMPRRVDRASRLVAQTTTAIVNNLQRARLQAAAAQGQRIHRLDVSFERRIGLWETAAIADAHAAGRRAALASLAQIRSLLQTDQHKTEHCDE